MMQVTLNTGEIEILFRQDPRTERRGGYQSFLVRLQRNTDRNTGALTLTDSDLEKIPRYAFDYAAAAGSIGYAAFSSGI